MLLRIFSVLIVLAALIVGSIVIYLPRDQLVRLMVFRDFFEVALPILGVGALIKYLFTCQSCPKCNKE